MLGLGAAAVGRRSALQGVDDSGRHVSDQKLSHGIMLSCDSIVHNAPESFRDA